MSTKYGRHDGIDRKSGVPVWKQFKHKKDGTSDEIYEMESHFIIRLPEEEAEKVRAANQDESVKDGLKSVLQLQMDPNMREGTVMVDGKPLHGRLKDLPCILESQKTLDRKTFYKCSDISQMLVCRAEPWPEEEAGPSSAAEAAKKAEKVHQWPHGLTPPLKNVRKRRFRKTLKKKYMDAPELERELKRLLREDLEADSVRYELVTEAEDAARRADGRASSAPKATLVPKAAPAPAAKPREFCLDKEDSGLDSSRDDGADAPKESASESAEMVEIMEAQGILPQEPQEPEEPSALRSLRSEVEELGKRKGGLEAQIKALDNPMLKGRMEEDLAKLLAELASKKEELKKMLEN